MIQQITPTKEFKPYPAYADRTAWNNLPQDIKSSYLAKAKELKDCEWESLPAVRYMDFLRNGNRTRYQDLYFGRRQKIFNLMMAECIEGAGEYIDDIINGIWLLCEETTWVVPAHNNQHQSNNPCELCDIESPVYIDLFAAETGSLVSWVYYFLAEEIAKQSPLVKRRIELEMERRILTPYLQYLDYGWMGLNHERPVNNWNPWINSNMLTAYLVFAGVYPKLCEQGVPKTIKSINRFLHFYVEDGGCDEGPGYFNVAGASVLDYIEELGWITDVDYLYQQPLIKNMAAYIYKVYIGGGYFVNYADAAPKVIPSVDLLARTGKKIGDNNLIGAATHLREHGRKETGLEHRSTLFRILGNYFVSSAQGDFIPPKVSWFNGIQVVTARDNEGSLDGLFFSAKGGCNDESHNHNDIGNFLVYCGGTPAIIDAGVETYTKFTFSSTRYDLWTMQSCYHNTPTINGADQLAGIDYRAKDVTFLSENDSTSLSMDIGAAYPEQAGIKYYKREFLFRHGESITVTDKYEINDCQEPLILNFLCYDKPEQMADKILLSGKVAMQYNQNEYDFSIEKIKLTDPKILADWEKDTLYRLRLTAKQKQLAGSVEIVFTEK